MARTYRAAGYIQLQFNSVTYQSGPACITTITGQGLAAITVGPAPAAAVSGCNAPICRNGTAPTITFTNPQALPVVTYNINLGLNWPTINIAASSNTVFAPTGYSQYV